MTKPKPLRNDWHQSLLRGALLCREARHPGDAATIEDVIEHLQKQAALAEKLI